MSETLLLQHTLLFSAAALALLLLRPLLRHLGGASAQYLGWLALPMVLASPALPRPAAASLPAPYSVQFEALARLEAPQALTAAAPAGRPWLALWAAGALLLATLLARRQWQFQRQLRAGRLPAGHSPAWLGLWGGRLCLPRDFRQRFDARERRLIRAHERVHARRRDNLWTLLATLLWLLNWFNPLAWWALRRFRGDQELAADAQVLQRHPGELGPYLRALAKAQPGLAPLGAGAPFASPFSPHPLVERIRQMKSPTARRYRPWVALLSSALMLGAAWAIAPATDPQAAPAASATKEEAPFGINVRVGNRQADHQTVHLDSDGAATVRLSSFKEKDLLLVLRAKPDGQGGERIHAVLQVGFPQNSSTELRSEVRRGEPVQVQIADPERQQSSAWVSIQRQLPFDERWALDPDQSGSVAFDIQAYVDGQAVGTQRAQTPLGQTLALDLGAQGPLTIRGSLQTSARVNALLDLRFELEVGGRPVKPRVVTKEGVKAVIEFNSSEEPRVVRLEVTPRRLRP